MKNSKGFALATVLLFITVFVILGVALLGFARGNVQQSAINMKFDQHYYAAESAAQVAEQTFIKAVNEGAKNGDFDTVAAGNEATTIPAALETIYNNGLVAANLTVSAARPREALNDYNDIAMDEITFEDIGIEMPTQTEIDTPGLMDKIKVTITIPATAAGRTVPLYLPIFFDKGVMKPTAAFDPQKIKNQNGGNLDIGPTTLYGGDETELKRRYDGYIETLNSFKTNLNVEYTKDADGDGVDDGGHLGKANEQPLGKTYLASARGFPASSVLLNGMTHLRLSYGSTTPLPDGEYADLEYIYLENTGQLLLSGNYTFPKLKGIIALNGGNLIIAAGLEADGLTMKPTTIKIGPVSAPTDTGRCFVGGWSTVKINPNDADVDANLGKKGNISINNCIFYVAKRMEYGSMKGGMMEINYAYYRTLAERNTIPPIPPAGGYDIVTNCLFYSEGILNFNGPLGAGSMSGTPQFYHDEYSHNGQEINMNYINQFNGVIITSSDEPIFDPASLAWNPGTGKRSIGDLHGLVVGNCSATGSPDTVLGKVEPLEGDLWLNEDKLLDDLLSVDPTYIPKIEDISVKGNSTS